MVATSKGIEERKQKEKNPLVSILIPIYNRVHLVNDVMHAVLSQTYDNIEIIVVDNKSDDGTWEKLIANYRGIKSVKLFQNEQNVGPVRNWERCVQYASGTYVKILFSDDLIHPQYIRQCVRMMEKNKNAGFVYSSVRFFEKLPNDEVDVTDNTQYQGYKYKFGNVLYHATPTAYRMSKTGVYSKKFFIENCYSLSVKQKIPVSASCAMFRKDAIRFTNYKDIKVDFPYMRTGAGIDLMLFLNALVIYDNFCYLDKPWSYFRYHEDSITLKEKNLETAYNAVKCHYIEREGLGKKIRRNNTVILLRELSLGNLLNIEKVEAQLRFYYRGFEKHDYGIDVFLKVLSYKFRKLFWQNYWVQKFQNVEIIGLGKRDCDEGSHR